MATPQYEIGDVVYIKESAALGFLESYKVASIYQPSLGRIIYYLSPGYVPESSVTFGDQISNVIPSVMYFDESELVTYETALELATQHAQNALDKLQRLNNGT